MACAATFAMFAASDRMDIYDRAGKFISVMVDDIKEINAGQAEGKDGYSTVRITTAQGTTEHTIKDIAQIEYSRVKKNKAHDIFISSDPHAKVRLLDWRNNTDIFGEAQIDPTKPDDWRGCWADGNPHYLVDTEKGYTSEVVITGTYTNKVYTDNPNFVFWSTKENNLLGIDSYSFDMPYEPVEIKSVSEELDTYEGAPFLGNYKGYLLTPESNRISRNTKATLSVEFKANTTYVITSTDKNAYDVIDLYKWNQEKNTVSYIPYEGPQRNPLEIDIWYGLVGNFTGDGILFATMHNIVEDKPDNNVKYFATNKDADVTVAVADQYNRYALVQSIASGEKARYFYYDEGITIPQEVTMEFVSGDNIAKNSVAYCVSGGDRIFKYTYTEGGEPVYTFRGKEYGTYKSEDGGAELTLDGFDTCTLGGKQGTYEIKDGVVNATIGSETYTLIIDLSMHTYKDNSGEDNSPWTGAVSYRITNAVGKYSNEPEAAIHTMSIDFDRDLFGHNNPGFVAIRMDFSSNGGLRTTGGVSDICNYIYNAKNNTVTITSVYVGTAPNASGKKNLILHVSADKRSIWFDDSTEDRIYGIGRDGSYWLTGEVNTLVTDEVLPVKLFDKYIGIASLNPEGMSLTVSCNVSLTFDTETNKASFNVFDASHTYLDMPEAEYTLNGNTLTIKNVTVSEKGEGGYVDVTRDFTFTVSEDGTVLTSNEKFTKYINQYSIVNIDFAGKEFKYTAPVVGPGTGDDSVELADGYTGNFGYVMYNMSWQFSSVNFDFNQDTHEVKVTLSSTNTGSFDFTSPYTLNGNVLTLTVKDYTNYSSPTDMEITLTVSADGKTITGDGSQTSKWFIQTLFSIIDLEWGKIELTAKS